MQYGIRELLQISVNSLTLRTITLKKLQSVSLQVSRSAPTIFKDLCMNRAYFYPEMPEAVQVSTS